jgi:drug/metabolite transporter (DMT)-like permease
MGLVSESGKGIRAFLWAAGTGVFIAGYTLCYKAALDHGAHPVGLYGLAMLVALLFQTGSQLRRPDSAPGPRRQQWGLVLTAGVLCTASFLFYLWALALAGCGAMATLRNTSIVFALLFSRISGERPTFRQWAGAALVTAGAVGLAWPS